jgi:hypothetical protein
MLFAAIIGAYFFGDQLTWLGALSAAVIIGSVVLYQLKDGRLIRAWHRQAVIHASRSIWKVGLRAALRRCGNMVAAVSHERQTA